MLTIRFEVSLELTFPKSIFACWVISTSDLILFAVKVKVMMHQSSLDQFIARLTIFVNVITLLFVMILHLTLSDYFSTVVAGYRKKFTVQNVLFEKGLKYALFAARVSAFFHLKLA